MMGRHGGAAISRSQPSLGNVSKCGKVWQHTLYLYVRNCIYKKYVLKCAKTVIYSKMFRNVAKCGNVLGNVSKCTVFVTSCPHFKQT